MNDRQLPVTTTRARVQILEVSNEPGRDWTWMASVSRMRAPGRPYYVKEWKPEWFTDADAELRKLLKGVGAEDIDVPTRMRALGMDPGELAGHHLWRTMTREEQLALHARKQEGS